MLAHRISGSNSATPPASNVRLLIILPSPVRGGAEEYALTIGTEAVRAGWTVHLGLPRSEGTASLAKDFSRARVEVHGFDPAEFSRTAGPPSRPHLSAFGELRDIGRDGVHTAGLVRAVRPDVVHMVLSWPYRCLGSLLALGLLQVRTAVVFQLVPPYPPLRRRAHLYSWARSRRQMWIAVSRANAALLGRIFRCEPKELAVIHNGTATDVPCPTPAARRKAGRALRAEMGLPENSYLCLAVGRLEPQKGFDDLIAVAPQLIRSLPEVRFLVAGDGDERESLREKARDLGVEEHLILLGGRSDVPRLMRAADLFVFPSRFEGHPFALLEAMAHGLPLVSSNAGPMREIVASGEHGMLFDRDEPSGLLDALRWSIEHPADMERMAANARIRVRDFSRDRMVAETLGLLRSLRERRGQMAVR
jgi:glycosyltransferase involved in cell wall biosynthesis